MTTYGPDAATQRIKEAIKNAPELEERLSGWLESKGYDIILPTLLDTKEYAWLREKAIKELHIP
ncbi:MAG: hypothetical protein HGA78_03980 [Nitrospirales bacterium]|nr:hypothetical protein [Nitrospirales bacterium]